ncbi:MAG: hypothetical protein ACYC2Y_04275 [Armatimonadota bacterium]
MDMIPMRTSDAAKRAELENVRPVKDKQRGGIQGRAPGEHDIAVDRVSDEPKERRRENRGDDDTERHLLDERA